MNRFKPDRNQKPGDRDSADLGKLEPETRNPSTPFEVRYGSNRS